MNKRRTWILACTLLAIAGIGLGYMFGARNEHKATVIVKSQEPFKVKKQNRLNARVVQTVVVTVKRTPKQRVESAFELSYPDIE